MSKHRRKSAPIEPKAVDAQDVAVTVEEPATPKADVPTLSVKVYRDEEGRLVLDYPGKKRIAQTDAAFVEVVRLFAEDVVKAKLV